MLSRLPDPSWGKEDGLQAKAADRVREVAGEYLAAGGARAAECSPPLQPGPLVCQSKRPICPFAKNVNRRAHLGAPLFTHLWSREVLIGETPNVFLFLRCQHSCEPETVLWHSPGLLRPGLRQPQHGFLPFTVLGKRHFEKCFERH